MRRACVLVIHQMHQRKGMLNAWQSLHKIMSQDPGFNPKKYITEASKLDDRRKIFINSETLSEKYS